MKRAAEVPKLAIQEIDCEERCREVELRSAGVSSRATSHETCGAHDLVEDDPEQKDA